LYRYRGQVSTCFRSRKLIISQISKNPTIIRGLRFFYCSNWSLNFIEVHKVFARIIITSFLHVDERNLGHHVILTVSLSKKGSISAAYCSLFVQLSYPFSGMTISFTYVTVHRAVCNGKFKGHPLRDGL
jgi:hypothetical protein